MLPSVIGPAGSRFTDGAGGFLPAVPFGGLPMRTNPIAGGHVPTCAVAKATRRRPTCVPTGDERSGTLNISGAYYQNGMVGVTCSGRQASFATEFGIVTHC